MNIVNVEENKNNIVKKYQDLVHLSRYKLSELGIKVISVLIAMIKVSDTEFHQYAIKISDFKELINSDSKDTYKYTHKLISELMSNPMKIGDEQFNWVSYGRYSKGDNVVMFEIHRNLKPYLLGLQSNFLQYDLVNILKLKSGYVIRFYELCKDHLTEGNRYKVVKKVVFDMKIERMRELFEIPASYQYSSHIKKHILEKSVKQFKEKTDIQIEYTEQKIGRRVDRIIITVRHNDKGSNDYLSNRKAFIAHIRENYINADLIETTDKHTGNRVIISVAPDGKLYDKLGSTYEASRADEIWDTLFSLAQQGKLAVMNRATLF